MMTMMMSEIYYPVTGEWVLVWVGEKQATPREAATIYISSNGHSIVGGSKQSNSLRGGREGWA